MNRRPWINRYGTVVILLLVLLVINPELQAFLLVTNFIGPDLMIFLIALQLRYLIAAVPSFPQQTRTFLCVAGYATLRVTTRMIGLLLTPVCHVTAGLTTLLFVLSKNMWCPNFKQGLTAI